MIEPQIKVTEEILDKPNIIADARLLAERIEKANKTTEELLNRQEKLKAEQILSGRADVVQQIKPPEINPREYAQKALSGEFNKLSPVR